jgi:hypothetical protein
MAPTHVAPAHMPPAPVASAPVVLSPGGTRNKRDKADEGRQAEPQPSGTDKFLL